MRKPTGRKERSCQEETGIPNGHADDLSTRGLEDMPGKLFTAMLRPIFASTENPSGTKAKSRTRADAAFKSRSVGIAFSPVSISHKGGKVGVRGLRLDKDVQIHGFAKLHEVVQRRRVPA